MSKFKLNDAITKKTFLTFVLGLLFFYVMNVLLESESIDPKIKFIIYVCFMFILVLFGIERPGVGAFMNDVFTALRDGKLTAEEKVFLIESATDNIFSYWANLKAVVAKGSISYGGWKGWFKKKKKLDLE